MGFFDKVKGVMNAVTGGGANVVIEHHPPVAYPGEALHVRVTLTSTGGEVKSQGVFVDVVGCETVEVPQNTSGEHPDVRATRTTYSQQFQIAAPLVLGAGQQQVVEGQIQLPPTAQPTFVGELAKHEWTIRGRLEAFGNDPDSGYQPLRVGVRA